ncbi:MAG: hypothetical protein K6L60_13880 [Oceanobacter sp.]
MQEIKKPLFGGFIGRLVFLLLYAGTLGLGGVRCFEYSDLPLVIIVVGSKPSIQNSRTGRPLVIFVIEVSQDASCYFYWVGIISGRDFYFYWCGLCDLYKAEAVPKTKTLY